MTAANLQRVQDLTGVHIALVGHTGKDQGRGARVSNAHEADVDMMVQVSVADEIRPATIPKINNGADGGLTRVQLHTIHPDQDEDGDEIATAIVSDERLDTAKENSRAKLTKSQRKAMEMLDRAIIDIGRPGPTSTEYPRGIRVVSVEQWRETCRKGGL